MYRLHLHYFFIRCIIYMSANKHTVRHTTTGVDLPKIVRTIVSCARLTLAVIGGLVSGLYAETHLQAVTHLVDWRVIAPLQVLLGLVVCRGIVHLYNLLVRSTRPGKVDMLRQLAIPTYRYSMLRLAGSLVLLASVIAVASGIGLMATSDTLQPPH